MSKYSILREKNEWLKNYRGHTFSDRLQSEIIKGVFEEHAKFKYNIPFLKNGIYEQLGKKCLIACIEPNTKELLSVGSSSLLKDESTGMIIDNLILDNFGIFFARLFIPPAAAVGADISLKDDGGVARNYKMYNGGNTGDSTFNFVIGTACAMGTQIKMGSGSSAVARTDFKIQTSLPSPPESGYLNTNDGAYTAQNTVIYQGDANSTGGGSTVREAGSFGVWEHSGVPCALAKIMISHDAISPVVPYTSGKLLRGAYIWSI